MKFFYVIGCCFLFNSFSAIATKKACQPHVDNLRNIQSQQRAGYSNKQGRKLAEREDNARKKWWKCQKGTLSSSAKKSKKKKSYAKKLTKMAKPSVQQKPSYSQKIMPLTNHVVMKGKYQGDKQQAWLDFYRQPAKCKSPRSTKQFAFCMENRQDQQRLFEQTHEYSTVKITK